MQSNDFTKNTDNGLGRSADKTLSERLQVHRDWQRILEFCASPSEIQKLKPAEQEQLIFCVKRNRRAIGSLENAQLSEILGKLQQNRTEFIAGTENLKKSLTSVNKSADTIRGVASVLGTVKGILEKTVLL